MAFLIIAPTMKVTTWAAKIKAAAPSIDLRVWPEYGARDDIDFILCWRPPQGELRQYPRLKCIASMGAGVDHILSDPQLPPHTPITRIVHPSMPQSMSEYVIMSVLNHIRHTNRHRLQQSRKIWRVKVPLMAADTRIGVMGLGQLGQDAARKFVGLGFPVSGWSRAPKQIDQVDTYAGQASLPDFLESANVLICMLPLTPETQGILNRPVFETLPAGAYVINVARGPHLVEPDLLDMLASGHLSGACLDVFNQEPLPPTHPFWDHPKITITPHISSLTNPKAVVPQIVDNYNRVMSDKPLKYVIDRKRGY